VERLQPHRLPPARQKVPSFQQPSDERPFLWCGLDFHRGLEPALTSSGEPLLRPRSVLRWTSRLEQAPPVAIVRPVLTREFCRPSPADSPPSSFQARSCLRIDNEQAEQNRCATAADPRSLQARSCLIASPVWLRRAAPAVMCLSVHWRLYLCCKQRAGGGLAAMRPHQPRAPDFLAGWALLLIGLPCLAKDRFRLFRQPIQACPEAPACSHTTNQASPRPGGCFPLQVQSAAQAALSRKTTPELSTRATIRALWQPGTRRAPP
jgi:hypothetical protein